MNTMLKKPEPGKTTPTLGFNLNQLILNDVEYIVWEGGGQIAYRRRWGRGMMDSNILLFVLDTSAVERFEEAKKELDIVLNDLETREVPLIMCFHKMDLDKSKTNLPTAKGMFHPPLTDDRKVFQAETSIEDIETIEKLKDQLIEIIEQSRW